MLPNPAGSAAVTSPQVNTPVQAIPNSMPFTQSGLISPMGEYDPYSFDPYNLTGNLIK